MVCVGVCVCGGGGVVGYVGSMGSMCFVFGCLVSIGFFSFSIYIFFFKVSL